MNISQQQISAPNHKLDVDQSCPLEMSWMTLLGMASACCFLTLVVIAQIIYLAPTPKKAVALRQIAIPETAIAPISEGYRYRHFIAQIVQTNRRHNFFEGRDLTDLIIKVSIQEDIDPLLVAAIIKAESTFHTKAISPTGAHGLMQIQPDTARYISQIIDQPWESERFIEDPEYNLRLGINYLKYLSNKFNGDLLKVLAAYNWGPGNVKRVGGVVSSMPAETRKYITSVTGNHQRWKTEMQMQRAAVEQFKDVA